MWASKNERTFIRRMSSSTLACLMKQTFWVHGGLGYSTGLTGVEIFPSSLSGMHYWYSAIKYHVLSDLGTKRIHWYSLPLDFVRFILLLFKMNFEGEWELICETLNGIVKRGFIKLIFYVCCNVCSLIQTYSYLCLVFANILEVRP